MEEQIIKEGSANLQKNIETLGGKLVLSTKTLAFKSHELNLQSGDIEIELSAITKIDKVFTKFLGLIPVFPNALSIHTNNGQVYNFTLYGRSNWLKAINNAKSV